MDQKPKGLIEALIEHYFLNFFATFKYIFRFKVALKLFVQGVVTDRKILASVAGVVIGLLVFICPVSHQKRNPNENPANYPVLLFDTSVPNLIKVFNAVDPMFKSGYEINVLGLYCQKNFPDKYTGIHLFGPPPGLPAICYGNPASAIGYDPNVKAFFLSQLAKDFTDDRNGYFKRFMFPTEKLKALGLLPKPSFFSKHFSSFSLGMTSKERQADGRNLLMLSLIVFLVFFHLFTQKKTANPEFNGAFQAMFFLTTTAIPMVATFLYIRFAGDSLFGSTFGRTVGGIAWILFGTFFAGIADSSLKMIERMIFGTAGVVAADPAGVAKFVGIFAGVEGMIYLLFASKNSDSGTIIFLLLVGILPAIILTGFISRAMNKGGR